MSSLNNNYEDEVNLFADTDEDDIYDDDYEENNGVGESKGVGGVQASQASHIQTPPPQPTPVENKSEEEYDEEKHLQLLQGKMGIIQSFENVDQLTLENIAEILVYVHKQTRMSFEELRTVILEDVTHLYLQNGIEDFANTILQIRPTDKTYLKLVCKIYENTRIDATAVLRRAETHPVSDEAYHELIKLLICSISNAVWFYLEDTVDISYLTGVAYIADNPFGAPSGGQEHGIASNTNGVVKVLQNNIRALPDGLKAQQQVKEPVQEPVREEPVQEKPKDFFAGLAEPTEEEIFEAELEEKTKTVCDQIMTILTSIYSASFITKPHGVLSRSGIICIDKQRKTPIIDTPMRVLSTNLVKTLDKVFNDNGVAYVKEKNAPLHDLTIRTNVFTENGDLVYNYLPMYHLMNIYGFIPTGDGQYREESKLGVVLKYVREDIGTKVKAMMKHGMEKGFNVNELELNLISLFTNVVIVRELNRTKSMSLKYHLSVTGLKGSNNRFLTGEEFAHEIDRNAEELLGSKLGKTVTLKQDDKGVIDFLYVYNFESYSKELLFTYKLFQNMIDSGTAPNLSSLVLGRKVDGSPYTLNMAEAGFLSMSIIAGSRSGKGVMTMGVVASVVGGGGSLVYLDFKPDMAGVFWELERKLSAETGKEVRIFSIDGKDDKTVKGNIAPNRLYSYRDTLPSYMQVNFNGFKYSQLRNISYIKGLCLVMMMVQYKRKYNSTPFYKSRTYGKSTQLVTVIDEFQTFNKLWGANIGAFLAEFDIKKEGKKGELSQEVLDYLQLLKEFQSSLSNEIGQYYTMYGGEASATLIALGQSTVPKDWDWGDLPSYKTPYYNVINKASARLLGANHGTGTKYNLWGNGKVKPSDVAGGHFVDKNMMGYFGFHKGSEVSSAGSIDILKSYFVLNFNDVDHIMRQDGSPDYNLLDKENKFTGGLLANQGSDAERNDLFYNELTTSEGQVNRLIGFDGVMMQLLQGIYPDKSSNEILYLLAETLGSGYDLAWDAMLSAGLTGYSCVEEYLYDCRPEALMTPTALVEKIMENGNKGINWADPSTPPPPNVWSNTGGQTGLAEGEDFEDFGGYTERTENNQYVEPQPIRNSENANNVTFGEENGHIEDEWNGNNIETNPFDGVKPTNEVNTAYENNHHYDSEYDGLYVDKSMEPSVEQQDEFPFEDPYEDEEPPVTQQASAVSHTMPKQDTGQQQVAPVREQRPTPVRETAPISQGTINTPTPLRQIHDDSNAYTEPLKLKVNDVAYRETNFGDIALTKTTSWALLEAIANMTGGLDGVFSISFGGVHMTVNGEVFKPKIDPEVIESLPYTKKRRVMAGDYSELFFFEHLKEFKRLNTVIFENINQAEGRARDELRLHPSREWTELFNRFPTLMRIQVGGIQYTREEWMRGSTSKAKEGYEMREGILDSMKKAFGAVPRYAKPTNDFVNRSTPLRIFKNATVATAATWATLSIATAFGGWGLLWGAFVGYGAYKSRNK